MSTFTDAAGEVVSKSTIGNTLLLHGRLYDAETNMYYFCVRYYYPIMGRFLQNNPMGYEDFLNLYQDFNVNPVNFVEPFGLALINIFLNFLEDSQELLIREPIFE